MEDEAKHLYNETVIRALKEEYELISSDKNELLEQLTSLQRIEAAHRSSSTTEGNDWDDQIVSVDVPSEETNLSSNLVNNESQTNGATQDPLAKVNNELERVLQVSNEKIQRAMIERPELFDDASEETIDHLIAALDKQASQIDRLKAELKAAAASTLRFAFNLH